MLLQIQGVMDTTYNMPLLGLELMQNVAGSQKYTVLVYQQNTRSFEVWFVQTVLGFYFGNASSFCTSGINTYTQQVLLNFCNI